MLKPFIITDDTTAEADNDDEQDTDAAAVDNFGSNVAHAANIPAVTFQKFTALPIAKVTQHDDSRVDMLSTCPLCYVVDMLKRGGLTKY